MWDKLDDAEREARRATKKKNDIEKSVRLERSFREGLKVCVDLSYTDANSERETRSLARQLAYAYSELKQGRGCISLQLAGYTGLIEASLKQLGADSWLVHRHTSTVEKSFAAHSLVYLTPDASEELAELSEDKVYVIGGIVDRTPSLGLSIARAESLGVETARLPLSQLGLRPTMILNVNHVIEAIARFQDSKDWSTALRAVVPGRMVAQAGGASSSNSRDKEEKEREAGESGRTFEEGCKSEEKTVAAEDCSKQE